jgi:hypothetical protein
MTTTRQSSSPDHLEVIRSQLGESWLPQIYRERILKTSTRAYHFGPLARNAAVTIQHTLLGVELKIGRRRFLCPDLATARYLCVFARAGCESVAIPYDITKISVFADELESAWQRIFLLIEHNLSGQAIKARIQGRLIAKLRTEIAAAGAGKAMPEFKQSTKQRRS